MASGSRLLVLVIILIKLSIADNISISGGFPDLWPDDDLTDRHREALIPRSRAPVEPAATGVAAKHFAKERGALLFDP